MQLFSAFFQDEVALVPNKLYVTLGTKLEHNLYTGFNLDAERTRVLDTQYTSNVLGSHLPSGPNARRKRYLGAG